MNDKPNAYLHEHLGQRHYNDYVPPEKMRLRQFAVSERTINNRVCVPTRRQKAERSNADPGTQ